jgi:hypothetical protein
MKAYAGKPPSKWWIPPTKTCQFEDEFKRLKPPSFGPHEHLRVEGQFLESTAPRMHEASAPMIAGNYTRATRMGI